MGISKSNNSKTRTNLESASKRESTKIYNCKYFSMYLLQDLRIKIELILFTLKFIEVNSSDFIPKYHMR